MAQIGQGAGVSWPTSLDTPYYNDGSGNFNFANGAEPISDSNTRYDAEILNDIGDLLLRLEQVLGLTPAGASASVAARLAAIESAIAALEDPPVATETQAGVIELATLPEVMTGTDFTRAVTPGALASRQASETLHGLIAIATDAMVQAGTDANSAVTPAGLSARTATETRTGVVELATQAEVTTGTDDLRAVTPLTLQTRLAAIPAVPAASETVAGIAELATTGEIATGTDALRIVTPAGLVSRAATATATGLVELATSAETITGTDTGRAVTPAGLHAKVSTETAIGLVELATQAEVTTGTDDARAVTPLKLQTRIAAIPAVPAASETVAGLVELATSAETTTGTDTTRAVTPAGLAAKLPAGPPLSVARYAADGTTLEAAPLVVDAQGNAILGTATPGTSAQRVLVLPEGTAPTAAHPADAVQLWVENRAGTAGKGSLLVRTEDGTSHVLGDRVGIGTLTPAVALDVVGAIAVSDAPTTRTNLGVGTASDVQHARLGLGIVPGAVEPVPLVFANTIAHKITFFQVGSFNRYGIGLSSGIVQIYAASLGTSVDLCGINTIDGTLTVALRASSKADQNVGVGGTLLTATLGSGASYQKLTVNGSTLYVGQSTVQERPQALVNSTWVVSTDATRTARLTLAAYDATAAREGVRIEADGAAARLGFYGGTAVVKPTVTGVKGGNTALASLLTALANLGLIVDSTT